MLAIGVVPGGLFIMDERKETGWVVHDQDGMYFAGTRAMEDGTQTTWTRSVMGAYLFGDEASFLEFATKVNEEGLIAQQVERSWRCIREPMKLVKNEASRSPSP